MKNFCTNPFAFKEAQEKISLLKYDQIENLKKELLLVDFNKNEAERTFRLVPQILIEFVKEYNIDLNWLKQGIYANLILKLTKVFLFQSSF